MASAEEPGLLPELGAKSSTVELKTSEGANPKLTTAAGTFTCGKLDPTTAKAEGAHINLFLDVDLMYLECQSVKGESKLKCRSETLKGEKDPEGTVLLLVDLHLVDLLNGTSLVPGVELIILDQNTLEIGNDKIKCGIGNFEIKGVDKGLIKVATLTADVKAAEIEFPTSLPCDTNDTLCKSLESPFEASFAGKFEKATETVKVPVTTNVEVLFDD
jgi:hypothetical protein